MNDRIPVKQGVFDWSNKEKTVQILVDNDSWILPFANRLVCDVRQLGHRAILRRDQSKIEEGDIVFLLGCTRIVSQDILEKNFRNLLVHESDLPEGRGFAPLTWAVLQGRRDITFCLLDANADFDSGDVYLRKKLSLNGSEICGELREIQGLATLELCLEYLTSPKEPASVPQNGIPSYLSRRTPQDSRLDVDKSIRDQFNLLRVCDNERYPAHFEIGGEQYVLKLYRKTT